MAAAMIPMAMPFDGNGKSSRVRGQNREATKKTSTTRTENCSKKTWALTFRKNVNVFAWSLDRTVREVLTTKGMMFHLELSTVWKFVNFRITQILREINFGTV